MTQFFALGETVFVAMRPGTLVTAGVSENTLPFIPRAARIESLQRLQGMHASEVSVMAKVFTIPVLPDPTRRRSRKGLHKDDPRYIEGQRLLVEAMKYLIQQDPEQNKDAVLLLSEHFRTRFRMTDRPDEPTPAT